MAGLEDRVVVPPIMGGSGELTKPSYNGYEVLGGVLCRDEGDQGRLGAIRATRRFHISRLLSGA